MTITATFYESWIRTIGSLPMRLMSAAILELGALGEHELAKDLMLIRERWAKAVSQRAKVAVEADRLQRVGAVLESALLGRCATRPTLQCTLAEAQRQVRALGVGDGDSPCEVIGVG